MDRSSLLAGAFAATVLAAACTGSTGNEPSTKGLIATTAAPATATTTTSTTVVALGPELLTNGGLDDGEAIPTGWEFLTKEPDQVVAWLTEEASGGRYVAMSAPLREDAGWPSVSTTLEFAVSPGTAYLVTFDARTDTEGLLSVSMAFHDDEGTFFIAMSPPRLTVSSGDWSPMKGELTAPDGAVNARLIFYLSLDTQLSEEDAQSVDVDNVSVREVLG